MEVKIEEIENIIIQQGDRKYRLICEEDDWIFVDLEDGKRHTSYSKKSAYIIVTSTSSKIISIPKKIKKFELWTY